MRQYVTQSYDLKLTFAPPFLSQAAGTLAFGSDVAMQRYHGQPALNGSLIRGNIRAALDNFVLVLGEKDSKRNRLIKFTETWFGRSPKSESGDDKMGDQRSRIRFDLFWLLQSDVPKSGRRNRIQIEASGKVKDGALQFIEDCFPVGSGDVVFHGKIKVQLSGNVEKQKEEKADLKRYLSMALESISAMGSLKGIGFGELKGHSLTESSPTGPASQEASTDAPLLSDTLKGNETRIGFRFRPDRPFCVGKPKTPDSNRIVSDDVIGGHVIKGVMANTCGDDKASGWRDLLCFDQLHISHAVPVKEALSDDGERHFLPVNPALPLSLAFVAVSSSNEDEPELWDFANSEDAFAKELDGLHGAPRFQPDWKSKHWEKATQQNNVCHKKPERLVLVRTGIDHQRGVSSESQLFSMECVDPAGFHWQGEIGLEHVPENQRSEVLKHLQDLFAQGLDNIGKTGASMTEIELFPVTGSALPEPLDVGDRVIVTLETEARLIASGFERSGERPSLKELYKQYWQRVSSGGLELVTFYAQQYREGGVWYHSVYQKGQAYCPEWLSKAGSVFVLMVNKKEGADLLNQWLCNGLPFARSDRDAQSNLPDWRITPYLPEHGFGKISLKLAKEERNGS
ncbi:MAG: hypothetical protein CSB47_10910 [Proteobacteria bacterium]|nr:MAG: hypothetical protein CSB47_10910 [Pseudomonadota bacterium]